MITWAACFLLAFAADFVSCLILLLINRQNQTILFSDRFKFELNSGAIFLKKPDTITKKNRNRRNLVLINQICLHALVNQIGSTTDPNRFSFLLLQGMDQVLDVRIHKVNIVCVFEFFMRQNVALQSFRVTVKSGGI